MPATADTYEAVTERILAEQPFMQRLAYRLARRSADADDLVQETILRAYNARDRFQTGTSMRAWLATILRRLFLTGAIKAKRRGTQTDTDSGDIIMLSGARAPETRDELTYEQKIERVDDQLKDALDRVPDPYRQPFVMFALDGFSYAEIAEQLGIPVGTVMSRIHRARQRMKARLGDGPPNLAA